ncbi:MAG: response regulator transcription factor [Caldilineae bacterium]|nr:response regulator transcription factor [Anaerolineae bacterium]MCB0205567.1 response regulator transcription factor [Anaerolineae bacterium]MCB0254972.1 response regulator transcription factor [Anaerolineae bacterium]MCB9154407.1 response regulator transcription factor [Caldilineae bacterium]
MRQPIDQSGRLSHFAFTGLVVECGDVLNLLVSTAPPMTQHILMVDDDSLLRRSLALQLQQAGYRTSSAATAEDGLAISQRDRPDLVLLDVGLPGMDGLEAVQQFKRQGDLPVIFLTARRRELDTILGLELGADDYITKPFNPDVLLARVKAVLRRSAAATPSTAGETERLVVGDLVIDPRGHTASVAGRQVELTSREFDLLHALALEAGVVLSIDDLIARVWGAEFSGEPQGVYVHVRWLREKIEENPETPRRIVNVRGKGYKLVAQNADESL